MDEEVFFTNGFLNNPELMESIQVSEKQNTAYFLKFHTNENGEALGQVYTKKVTHRYQCKLCRKFVDKELRDKKKTEKKESEEPPDDNSQSESDFSDTLQKPSCFIKKNEDGTISWVERNHHKSCVLITLGEAVGRSYKNKAVNFRNVYGLSSKQSFETHQRLVQDENPGLVNAMDLKKGFLPWNKAKYALEKSGKRVIYASLEILKITGEKRQIDKQTSNRSEKLTATVKRISFTA